MVAAARMAFDLVLPNEESGNTPLYSLPRDEIGWLRRLYEKAVAGFYAFSLSQAGWRVQPGKAIYWPQDSPTTGMKSILPSMKTDIVLDHGSSGYRIVIDTKFTAILTTGQYGKESLRSEHIYQIYAYLRSQEKESDPASVSASGLLLYPAVGSMVDESVVIQGHSIQFATVDLAGDPRTIRRQLLNPISPSP